MVVFRALFLFIIDGETFLPSRMLLSLSAPDLLAMLEMLTLVGLGDRRKKMIQILTYSSYMSA